MENKYEKGLVSVIIPTYKRSDLLEKAIRTVLNQTYRKIELIVVNDNEIGDQYSQLLYKLINGIKDERLIFVEQEKHINGAAARNVGIKNAKGEYIAFQDDDDYWDENKVERQVKILSKLDKSYGAVVCLKKFYYKGKLKEVSLPFHTNNMLLNLVEGSTSLGTGAVLIRRVALDRSGYWDESLSRHQDMQLFVRLASCYKIYLDKVYMQNRELMDTQNRPTSDKLLSIKKAYFKSIKDIIAKYPNRTQKRIYAMHNFEIAYCLYKEKKYKEMLKYAVTIMRSPVTIILAFNKIIRKIVGSKFKCFLLAKYDNH